MKDKNSYSDYYRNYGMIYDGKLPEKVRDQIIDNNDKICNDIGVIVNPEYNPLFGLWLIENDMPVECYIVWFSW